MNHYEVLGIDQNASADEIKRAHRRLAVKHHPDRGGDEAKFREVQEAYDTLSDPAKRARYDNINSRTAFNSPFGDIFNGPSWRNGQVPTKGEPISAVLNVDLKDLFNDSQHDVDFERQDYCYTCSGRGTKSGKSKTTCQQCKGSGKVGRGYAKNNFRVTTYVPCDHCRGTGEHVASEDACNDCNGQGVKSNRHSINITVPRGMPLGKNLIFREEGNVGWHGGPRGDVVVNVRPFDYKNITVNPQKTFELLCNLKIPFWKAVMGGLQKVEMPDASELTVQIPKGCQAGTTRRVKGAGLPIFGRSQRGDLVVKIDIDVPKEVPAELEMILHQMKDYYGNEENDN